MKTFLMATSALALLATTAPAFAQDAAAEDEAAPAEIVVTAQKRSERLQDVPVAVSVISGAALANQGGINLESAQYLVPSLNFRKAAVAINQSLFLRGVGTSNFSLAGEPSVSTVLDGVVYSRAGEAFSDLVDIERIEVLRGPQGTLFGKNASAGVVNIVSKRPTQDFEGSVEASFFSKSEYRGRAVLNLPISENAAARLTGFYGEYDGNIRNIGSAGDNRVNGYKRYGFRGTVVADLSPDVKATLIVDWRKSNDDCCTEIAATTPTNANAVLALAGVQFLGDKTRTIKTNLAAKSIQKSWGASLQVDATLGTQTITSITAYRKADENEIREGDLLDQAYVGLPQTHDVGPQTGNTFSQEFRLTSPGNQQLDYVLGAYFSRAETERTFTRNSILCSAVVGATGLIPCGSANAQPSQFANGTANFGSVFKNFSLFGQASFDITDAFRLIGGLRYTVDQLNIFHSRVSNVAVGTGGVNPSFDAGVFNNGLTGPGATPGSVVFIPGLPNGIPFRNKTTNENLSGKFGVQYDIVRNSMAYATYSRGYKGPAFNVFFNLNTTGSAEIAAESADAYEAGLKNTLFGGRLVVNLAAYYAKYKNFQANNPDVIAGVPVSRFTNAGIVSTRGGELDLIWRPMSDLSISGGVAYTDAHVDKFRVPPGGNPAAVIPSGTELAYAPKWKGSLAADYRIRTGGSIDFSVGGQGSLQSSQLSFFDASAANRAAGTIGGYGILDLQASIIDANDRFRVTFQVKNAFDQSFAAAIGGGGPGGSFRYFIPREADRYFGVTAKVNLGGK